MLSLRQRWEALFWLSLPGLLTIAAQLFAFVTASVPILNLVMQALPWITMAFFGLFLPRAMPYALVFAVGLLQDLVLGTPLGSSSLICMLLRYLLAAEQRYLTRGHFAQVWLYVSVLLFLVFGVQWVLLSLLGEQWFPVWPLIQHWLAIVVLYPVLHRALQALHRAVQRRSSSKFYN